MNLNYGLLLGGCMLLLLLFIIFKYYYYTYFIANIRVQRLIINDNNDNNDNNENIGENVDDLPKYSDIVPSIVSEPPSYNESISNEN